MVERIRTEIRKVMTGEGGGQRMSQAELDAYRRQLIMLGVSVTAILLILILGVGAYYQYIHLPRQSVAAVAGNDISRSDYWDFRRYELLMQINQYQQMAQFMQGEQAQQYQQLAFEADQEFENIEDADFDPMTVNQMINNRIVMDALDEFGIEVTEEEIQDHLVQYFTGMTVGEEIPGPSADPTAEAWATATAEAREAEMEEVEDPAVDDAEVDDQQVDDADPNDADDTNGVDDADEETTEADEADDPEVADDDEIDEMPTPEPTPEEEEIRATAEANQLDHERFLLDRAGLSHDEFVEMFIIPDIAREKIRDRLAEDVPTRAEHVHAAHILVATEDAANLIHEELTEEDADFAELAEEQSTDQQTAPNGGDLGWFPRGVMVDEFDEVVFDLDIDEISEPFQTEFGWHVVTVMDRDNDRPVELRVLEQFRQQTFQEWMDERREQLEIDTGDLDMPEAPIQVQDQFQPPAGAPEPPAPEMDPEIQQEIEIDGDEVDDLFEDHDPFEDIDDGDDDE